jgi:hypothetical protein
VARTSQPSADSLLLVACEAFTFDRPGIGATYIHPGAILRASNLVVKGHERFFRPLVLIAEFEPDLELTEVPVAITGLGDPDTPFTWLQMKIAGTVQNAETLFNVGE